MDERLKFVARQLADEPLRELSQPRQKALPAPVASPPPGVLHGHRRPLSLGLDRAPVAPSKATVPKLWPAFSGERMSILVIGATGFVGGGVTLRLVKRGHRVTALVRGGGNHEKANALLSAGVEVIGGDLTRPETLALATRNSDTVVCTATSMPSAADDGLRRVDHDGVLALIDAAEQQGIRRFVYVSYSGNIREDSPLETAKRECENRLLASKMEAVILRPSFFMEVWFSPALGFDPAVGSARIYGSGEAKVSYISAANVADFGLAAATRKYSSKSTILELGGPEPLSQLDVVRIFEKALNKKVKTDQVPVEALQAQHNSSDPLQKTFGALMLAYSKGDVVDGAGLAQEHGISLHSVTEFASSIGKAAEGIIA